MRPRTRVPRGQADDSHSPRSSTNEQEMQRNSAKLKKALPYLAGGGIVLFFVISRISQPKLGVEGEQSGGGWWGGAEDKLYLRREPIIMRAINMTSKTGQPPIPYFDVLLLCKYSDRLGELHEHLAQYDVSLPVYSAFEMQIRYTELCKIPCRKIVEAEAVTQWRELIDADYYLELFVGNVRVVSLPHGSTKERGPYVKGFPLGYKKDGEYYVYNHIAFTVEFHHEAETDYQKLVGLFAEPVSVEHTYKGKWNNQNPPLLQTCSQDLSKFPSATSDPQIVEFNKEIIFTYNVEFKETPRKTLPKGYPE